MSLLLEPDARAHKGPPVPPGVTLDLPEPDDEAWRITLWINGEPIHIRLSYTQMFAMLELVVAKQLDHTHTPLKQCSGGSRRNSHQIVLRLRKSIDTFAPGWGKRLVRSVLPFRGYRLHEEIKIRRRRRFLQNIEFFGTIVTDIANLVPDESNEKE